MTKPDTCQGCVLYTAGESFVWGGGANDPTHVLIGEAPGQTEAASKKPFCGGAGRVLNTLLGQAGMSRERCYVTNVVKCRPPGNKLDAYLPKAAEHCRQYLDRELEQHGTKPLILLGDVALRSVLGYSSIAKYRGGVYHWAGRMVLPTIHPAALMRNPSDWSLVVSDLRYARDMVRCHRETPRNFITRPTYTQVCEWFEQHVGEEREEPYFIDIETYGSSLACLGIAADESNVICIPWWDKTRWYWEFEPEAEHVTRLVASFLSNERIRKVLQNGTFDANVLEEYGFKLKGWVGDTMIAHHTIYSEARHSLAFLHSVYVREPYYKGMVHAQKDELEE